MEASVERVGQLAAEKLGIAENVQLVEVKSAGERCVFRQNDVGVMTGLSPNGEVGERESQMHAQRIEVGLSKA